MSNKILCTITTYNPEIVLLEKNIDAVISQVDKLIVYENDSANQDEVLSICADKGVEVLCNEKNYGVAKPLFDGVEYADKNGYDYILTLDQDSVMSDGAVEKLMSLILSDNKLAIVATRPILENNKDLIYSNLYVNSVITSGSLSDIAKIKEIGNYIPEMFIDRVDNEICYRALENGYKIMQSNVPMIHRLGESQKRRLLWRYVHVQHYSPMRYYYIFRNDYYCKKRYVTQKIKRNTNYLRYLVKVILYEKNKMEKLKAMRKGYRDGKAFYKEMKEKYASTKIIGDVAE